MDSKDIKTTDDQAMHFLETSGGIISEAYKVLDTMDLVSNARTYRIEIRERIHTGSRSFGAVFYERQRGGEWHDIEGTSIHAESPTKAMGEALGFIRDRAMPGSAPAGKL